MEQPNHRQKSKISMIESNNVTTNSNSSVISNYDHKQKKTITENNKEEIAEKYLGYNGKHFVKLVLSEIVSYFQKNKKINLIVGF